MHVMAHKQDLLNDVGSMLGPILAETNEGLACVGFTLVRSGILHASGCSWIFSVGLGGRVGPRGAAAR